MSTDIEQARDVCARNIAAHIPGALWWLSDQTQAWVAKIRAEAEDEANVVKGNLLDRHAPGWKTIQKARAVLAAVQVIVGSAREPLFQLCDAAMIAAKEERALPVFHSAETWTAKDYVLRASRCCWFTTDADEGCLLLALTATITLPEFLAWQKKR